MAEIPFFTVARDETQYWDPLFLQHHGIVKAYGIYLIQNGEATHCCSLTPASWAEFVENEFVLGPEATELDVQNAHELDQFYEGEACYLPFTTHDPENPHHSDLFTVEQDRRFRNWREEAWEQARHEPRMPRITQ